MNPPFPHDEYTRRLDAARALERLQSGRDRALANARLVLFALIAATAWLALGAQRVSAWWLVAPLGLFAALVAAHDRVGRSLRRATRAAAFYDRGLARLDDRWAGAGEPGERFRDPEHPYAEDLDLFGVGSVFERLCMARTHAGEAALAAWLLAPASPAVVRARHEAAAELRDRLDLREDIALLGDEVRDDAGLDGLADWALAPPRLGPPWLPLLAGVLSALTIGSFVGAVVFGTPAWPFWLSSLATAGLAQSVRRRVAAVLGGVDRRAGALAVLSGLLARIEREPFRAAALGGVTAALATAGRPASRQIAALRRRLDVLNWRLNLLFTPLAIPLLWGTQLAFALERWRRRAGPSIPGWLDAVGRFEALCALAAYAYENPDDAVPELVEGAGPIFEAQALGHPVLPKARNVRNDVALGGELRVLMVSGSNMSGKSTLLRSVGVAAVLAQAGAPVRAGRLRLSPLAVGATMRVQDSLQAGRSRFYAEIVRLRRLVDASTGPIPLLFLLDEILHGTNSHDRRAGAEAIVRGLIDRGAVGLVTTHDLALAEVAEALVPRARNVHFADRLVEGVLHFDYRMRPGVVQHSNALALMRAVGLDV